MPQSDIIQLSNNSKNYSYTGKGTKLSKTSCITFALSGMHTYQLISYTPENQVQKTQKLRSVSWITEHIFMQYQQRCIYVFSQLKKQQKHRIIAVGWHLWGLPSPVTQDSEQRQLEQLTWDTVQLGFDCLQGWGLHNLLGQPLSMPNQPYRKKSSCRYALHKFKS